MFSVQAALSTTQTCSVSSTHFLCGALCAGVEVFDSDSLFDSGREELGAGCPDAAEAVLTEPSLSSETVPSSAGSAPSASCAAGPSTAAPISTATGASMPSTVPPAASAIARLAPIPPALTSPEQDTSATPKASMTAMTAPTAASLPLSLLVNSLNFICLTFLHEAEHRFDKPSHETTNQLHPYRPIPRPVRTLPSCAPSSPPRSTR